MLRHLERLARTEAFRSGFPRARLLHAAEIAAMSETVPASLLPFMCDGWDVYALSFEQLGRTPIVVWADHAVVMSWETCDDFAAWLSHPRPGSE